MNGTRRYGNYDIPQVAIGAGCLGDFWELRAIAVGYAALVCQNHHAGNAVFRKHPGDPGDRAVKPDYGLTAGSRGSIYNAV